MLSLEILCAPSAGSASRRLQWLRIIHRGVAEAAETTQRKQEKFNLDQTKNKRRQAPGLVSFWLCYRATDSAQLVSASSTAAASRRSFRSWSYITCLDCRRRLWRRCASRNDPQLNTVFLAESTVENNDARLIDSSLRHQVIMSTCAEQICLADAARVTTVGDDIGRGCRIVLQVYGKVVEPSFLIVKGATAAYVKLPRGILVSFRRPNVGGSLCILPARRLARAIVHNQSCSDALAAETG